MARSNLSVGLVQALPLYYHYYHYHYHFHHYHYHYHYYYHHYHPYPLMDLPAFFARFPLHTYPPIPVSPRFPLVQPTLWIAPPRDTATLLSADVECLKWQAYLALRGFDHIAVRWDISPEGALDACLPNLHLPDPSPRLLPPRTLPDWADARLNQPPDPLEGYRDQSAKDESHAWVTLLEGVVHAALVRPPSPPPSPLISCLPSPSRSPSPPSSPRSSSPTREKIAP